MKRTTLLLDDHLLLEAQHLAKQRGTTFTTVVDEALRDYLHKQRTPRRLSVIGMGRSEQPTSAMQDGWDEAELRSEVGSNGWAPQRTEN